MDIRPGGYAVLTIKKEPVNSLDLGMWVALEAALDALEADKSVSGLILISGLQRDVFSAGNDLLELYAPKTSLERYTEFWVVSNRFLVKLYRSRLVTVAAVRGASPAGGCIMALCCDHRILTTTGTIGLNEVLLGIPVPKFWGMLMTRVLGTAAEKVLLTGKLMTPQEAKAVGLADLLVEGHESLLPAAEKLMSQLQRLPSTSYAATKLNLRDGFCKDWEAFYPVEPSYGWSFLNQPATLKVMAGAIARLSGKKAAPPSKL